MEVERQYKPVADLKVQEDTISHTFLGSPGTERGIFCRSSDKDGEERLSW